jgi:hypothetical protein
MDRRQALATKWHELGPLLQRRFWRPLRSMMEIFHVLPLAAAIVLFVFLATDAQFREIYISYLEGPTGSSAQWLAGLVAAAVALALTSAVLCEAHFSLSTMRINVVYSSYSNPDANSKLRSLQRTAGFCLTFIPWLGLAVGLFGARNFVADRYCKLLEEMPPDHLHEMQHLLQPGGWTIAGAIVVLGAATAAFSCVEQRTRNTQRAVALLAPAIAALLFLLFTDWLVFSSKDRWWLIFFAITVAATVLYFIVYRWLYRRQGGPIFSRSRADADDDPALAPEIDLTKSRDRLLAAWALSFFVAQPEFSTGIGMRKRRRQILIMWAFIPWLLFALYFAIVPYFAASAQASDEWYQPQTQPLCPIAATHVPVPGHWTIFPVAMCFAIALGLLVGLLLNKLSEQAKRRRLMTMGAVLVLGLAAIMVSRLLDVDSLVVLYRFIGPLGTVTLQLLFLISTFALLAWLSQRSGFPVLTLVILAIVICVMFPNYAGSTVIALGVVCILFAVTAFLSRLYAVGAFALILPLLGAIQWYQLQIDRVAQNPAAKVVSEVDPLAVKFQFECWLRYRGIRIQDAAAADQLNQSCPVGAQRSAIRSASGAAARKYPVFLIAAEGGGIYAASAASMFLGRLQQEAPHFAEHVFALSGVSGGAIGSTIFQALDKADFALSGSAPGQESLTRKVTEIMEDDHFSPVVGSIFPELMGASAGRAQTLVASFELSTAVRDAAAGRALSGPFAQHWAYTNVAPALVLNATWVETGFRVAFAPFHLHELDESLYSFSDVSMPSEDCPKEKDKRACVSLMDAAAVSARFPLVLPPFSTEMTDGKRWNFVDGGYTDNSGATTALDLYQTLKNVDPDDVDLQIVLITSSTPQPDLIGKEISGTVFRDTIAPVAALMKVREDMGNDAVARACSEVFHREPADSKAKNVSANHPGAKYDRPESNESCIDHAADPTAHLHIVEIQDQTYGLSLGWKISQTSFDVVSWMLGKSSECTAKPPPSSGTNTPPAAATGGQAAAKTADPDADDVISQQDGNAKLTHAIVLRNSCVMKSIVGLVEGRAVSAPGAAGPQGSDQ